VGENQPAQDNLELVNGLHVRFAGTLRPRSISSNKRSASFNAHLSGSLRTAYTRCSCWKRSLASSDGFLSGCTVKAIFR
jgi:hypothetical protein